MQRGSSLTHGTVYTQLNTSRRRTYEREAYFQVDTIDVETLRRSNGPVSAVRGEGDVMNKKEARVLRRQLSALNSWQSMVLRKNGMKTSVENALEKHKTTNADARHR